MLASKDFFLLRPYQKHLQVHQQNAGNTIPPTASSESLTSATELTVCAAKKVRLSPLQQHQCHVSVLFSQCILDNQSAAATGISHGLQQQANKQALYTRDDHADVQALEMQVSRTVEQR